MFSNMTSSVIKQKTKILCIVTNFEQPSIFVFSLQHQCCGVINFMDYEGSEYLRLLGDQIKPNASMSYACCKTSNELSDAVQGDGRLTVEAIPRGMEHHPL